jgi:hypothetical protein
LDAVMNVFGPLARCVVEEGPPRRGLVEYSNPSVTDKAVSSLTGQINLGGAFMHMRRLTARDAARTSGARVVVRLLHAVTSEELGTEEEVREIVEEVGAGAERFHFTAIKIATQDPRLFGPPDETAARDSAPVYIVFDTEDDAHKCALFLHNRRFAERPVHAETVSLKEFDRIDELGLDAVAVARQRAAAPASADVPLAPAADTAATPDAATTTTSSTASTTALPPPPPAADVD